MLRIALALACLGVAHSAEAVSYACTNGQYVATANIVLAGSDSINFVGTASARCTVLMKNFRITVGSGDSTYAGAITLKYADVFDCGTSWGNGAGCMAGTGVDYLYLNNARVVIEDSHFHRTGGLDFYAVNGASISFKRNTVWDDNLVSTAFDMSLSATNTPGWLHARGTSTATNYLQGNRFFKSWAWLESANWVVGAPTTCSSAADAALGNLFIGERAGFSLRGSGSTGICNYTHVLVDVTPTVPYWGDVENIYGVAAGSTLKHNVIRGGQWQVSMLQGTVTDNVFAGAGGHTTVRTFSAADTGGLFGYNIISSADPQVNGQRYGVAYGTGGGLESAVTLNYSGNTMTVRNNTFDLGGRLYISTLWAFAGSLTNFRNNVVYRQFLNSGTCPGTNPTNCSSAIGSSLTEGYVTPIPARLSYSDYNDFSFDAASTRKVVYDLTVSGKNPCDDDVGLHDLGTCNGDGANPLFKGPLPVGCGRLCGNAAGAIDGPGFPFNDVDIVAGLYTVPDLLRYYRWIYAPGTSSPLLNAQDPADGTNHIGAVRAADIPGSAPSIVTTNKRPMVWAGPSFITGTSIYGGTVNDAQMVGMAADDGLPSGILTCAWTLVNGPGTVTMDHADRCAMTITNFSASGAYTLRLTASDGSLSSSMDVRITKP